MEHFLIANMAPVMFGALVIFLLSGFPVAFSLAANGLFFGFLGIEFGLLTPQLLQTIRLLQLTAPQLELELRQALERNPLLESRLDEDEVDDQAPADAAAQECAAWDELPEPMFLSAGGHAGSGDEDATARIVAGESSDWRQRLLALLALEWRPHALALASFWLDHCDDRGYLEHDLQALGQRGAAELGVGADELEVARQRLLHGEWPGVAATDPAECLHAQLALQPEGPARALAARILAEHIELLATHDATALARALDAGEDDVHAAIALVLTLVLAVVLMVVSPTKETSWRAPWLGLSV